LIRSAASHDVSVILRGESGTGKELVARAIHRLSRRKDKPFVPVDCATLPETLLESELFGYEKGAFTGAYALKIGKVEKACGGTLFLDEIGNLIIHAQVKLLRILQERKIERLGGQKEIKIDARIITATNIDLEDAVRRGEFRDDLYHRLNVFEIALPALRERGEDIILLSHYFLDKFNKEMEKKVKGFSDEVLEIFNRYHWPGNVRELENTIRSAIILAEDRILPSHLTSHIKRDMGKGIMGDTSTLMGFLNSKDRNLEKISLKERKRNITEDLERYFIEKTLNQTNWNKKKAANILDIDYKSLFNKIKKYNLKRTIFD
jgi:transcriptional regulator with PAS, ATPase and Fis domain